MSDSLATAATTPDASGAAGWRGDEHSASSTLAGRDRKRDALADLRYEECRATEDLILSGLGDAGDVIANNAVALLLLRRRKPGVGVLTALEEGIARAALQTPREMPITDDDVAIGLAYAAAHTPTLARDRGGEIVVRGNLPRVLECRKLWWTGSSVCLALSGLLVTTTSTRTDLSAWIISAPVLLAALTTVLLPIVLIESYLPLDGTIGRHNRDRRLLALASYVYCEINVFQRHFWHLHAWPWAELQRSPKTTAYLLLLLAGSVVRVLINCWMLIHPVWVLLMGVSSELDEVQWVAFCAVGLLLPWLLIFADRGIGFVVDVLRGFETPIEEIATFRALRALIPESCFGIHGWDEERRVPASN